MTRLIRTLALAAALGALLASCAAAAPASSSAGRAERLTASAATIDGLAPCVDLPSIPGALCGTVTVPLDRADSASPTISVGYALVRRTATSRPGLGTIVPNPGGPGTSAIDATGSRFTAALDPLMDRRDVLLIDPRGVGRSDAIDCPALEGPDHVFADRAAQRRAIGDCGTQLGAAASGYGTAAVADDVDAVRKALGIDRLDLLGVSYGTFLMPVYAERHPTHVRSVTLAGAYSVHDDPTSPRGAAAFRRAVGLMCDDAVECSADRVLDDVAALSARLRTTPDAVDVPYEGVVHHVVIDEWRFASAAGRIFSKTPDVPGFTALVGAAAAARSGDLEPMRAFVAADLTASAEVADYGPGLVSFAQTWATTCHDYARPFDPDAPASQRQRQLTRAVDRLDDRRFAPFSAEAWVTRADYDAGGCVSWPAHTGAGAPFAPDARLPDVPVLVLNGDRDANTTSASGREAARQFPHATFVEIAGAGHTPANDPHGLARILRFIAHPDRAAS